MDSANAVVEDPVELLFVLLLIIEEIVKGAAIAIGIAVSEDVTAVSKLDENCIKELKFQESCKNSNKI